MEMKCANCSQSDHKRIRDNNENIYENEELRGKLFKKILSLEKVKTY